MNIVLIDSHLFRKIVLNKIMINNEIDKILRTILFPKKRINFKDITPLLLNFNLTDKIIDKFR